MKELLTKLPESSSEKRTIDFKAFHPQVISLVLDFVSNRGDRLSQINRAQQYIQVKAFADRFAHRGLFDRLNQIRDAVVLSDPLGFMQILVDEAVASAQGAHMKSKMKGIIRDVSQLTNDSETYKGTISSIAWDLLSEALAASGSSAIPSLSHRKQPTQSKQSTQVTSEIKHRIQDDVTSLISELKTAFTSDTALDEARSRMYTSDEMRDVIYALKDQFYVTSENHYPARWSSYNESIYGNDITEWDTPARALSTKTAQSLGMPFYRAFTFSLDEVLVQQNFRSGYLRDPRAPLPHHPQLHELSATADQEDEVILLQQDQPRGPSTESTSTSVPREITPELDLRSMLGDASPTLRSPTPESTVLLPKTFSISLNPPTPAPASLVAPHQQAAHSQLSDTSIVCGYRSTSRHPSASPASNLNWEHDGTFRTPPSQTLFHTVGGKKNAQPKATQSEVKEEPEAISDSRKDEYEYSGLPLWEDVWQRMKDYLKAGQSLSIVLSISGSDF